MAGHVQLKGFRSSADATVTIASKTTGEESADSIFGGRFRATRVWNGMLKRFRSGMPVKRHRRQLRVYDDCFTGREAVDFLMGELPKFIQDGKTITRSNCSKLLSIYLSMGLFCAVRGKLDTNEPFRENELYRFSSTSIELLAATPMLVRRAASFNEKCTAACSHTKEKNMELTALRRLQNNNWKNQNNDLMLPARKVIPLTQPSVPLSRRLSASHGNLPSMLSSRNVEDLSTERLTIRGVLKTAAPKQECIDRNTGNVANGSETSKRFSALDEVYIELMKISTTDLVDSSGEQNLRCFGKILQEDITASKPSQESSRAVLEERQSSIQLFLDANDIYKNVLLMRLRTVLQVDSLKGILDYEISGANVRWNCEQTGAKGIVRVPPESDCLSSRLVTMMRYLSRWPFDDKFANFTRVPYEGFELNVFKSICEKFDQDFPILPDQVALSVLNIMRLFCQRNAQKQSHADVQKETVFCTSNSPVTRYVHRITNTQTHTKYKSGNEGSSSLTKMTLVDEEHGLSPPNLTRSSVSTLSADSNNLSGRMAYEEILTRLPGLQRSPELMQRIEELAKTNTLLPRASTPHSEFSSLLVGICNENEKLLKEAVSLVLLTLEPRIRRRLHYLLRFMQRVSRNYCLRMERFRDNRAIVLESLPSKILRVSETINAYDCRQLVIFLMDNEADAFAIPNTLISEVKDQLLLQHEVGDAKETQNNERMKTHYCEPIDVKEYESQKKNVRSYLLALLDNILTDENLSPFIRKQRLKKFKRTYPEIYAQKFPSPGLPKTRLIDRIRSFHF